MPSPVVKNGNCRIKSNVLLRDWLIEEVNSLESPLSSHITANRLLKIIKFLKISYKDGLKMICADSNSLVLAEMGKNCCSVHERMMRSRFTSETKNCVILVTKYRFKFYSRQEIYTKFEQIIKTEELLPKFCVVEIEDFEMFNRDHVVDNCLLPWIYNDEKYTTDQDEVVQDEIDPFTIF